MPPATDPPRASRPHRRTAAVRVDRGIWLVLALSLFAVLPLAQPGYLGGHDAPQSLFFFTQFDAALRDGVWYPGWATDQAWGYGYATFVFYPPLAYYAAEAVHLLGAGPVAALKWVWALAGLGAGLAMYAYARRVVGRHRALLAAVVYVYVPYHLVDVNVRAALAEYCTFVWMPLALLAFHRLVERPSARRAGLAGLALGAVWLTHNATGLTFTVLLAWYVLACLVWRTRPSGGGRQQEVAEPASWLRPAGASLAAALLGLGLSAAMLIPALFEQRYVRFEQVTQANYDYALHFVFPFQLLSSFWGYGHSVPGPIDTMPLQVGAVPLLLAAAAVFGARRREAKERRLILFYSLATVVIVLFLLPVAKPLWAALPVASLIQFPWRLLALTAVTLSVLAGLAMPPRDEERRDGDAIPGATRKDRVDGRMLALALVVALAGSAYAVPRMVPVPDPFSGPRYAVEFEKQYPDMIPMTAWTEEMPASSPLVEAYLSDAPLVTAQSLAPDAQVEMIRAGGASDEMWVRSPQGTALRFYSYYFPGWRVYVDGRRLPDAALRPEPPLGLLVVQVPAGEHRVLLRWGDTPLRQVGKALTLASLALALILTELPPRRRRAA